MHRAALREDLRPGFTARRTHPESRTLTHVSPAQEPMLGKIFGRRKGEMTER